jgi:hypothetical protein
VTRQGCHFRSKRGNILKRFEQLCYWVREELRVQEAILDGEVVALDSDGRQNFPTCWPAAGTCTTPPSTLSGCAVGISATCRSLVGSEP